MILAVLANAAAAGATPAMAVPERQAQAVVKILKVEPIRFAEIERSRPEALRETQVRAPDGSRQPARLLEFE